MYGVDFTTGAFWSEAGAQRSAEPGMQKEALSLRGDPDKGRVRTGRRKPLCGFEKN